MNKWEDNYRPRFAVTSTSFGVSPTLNKICLEVEYQLTSDRDNPGVHKRVTSGMVTIPFRTVVRGMAEAPEELGIDHFGLDLAAEENTELMRAMNSLQEAYELTIDCAEKLGAS